MTPEQFVYWFKGFSETVTYKGTTNYAPSIEEWETIKANLRQVVFQTGLTPTTHYYETGTPPHLDPSRIIC